MTITLTPQAPLRFTLDRLRGPSADQTGGVADPGLFSDSDILQILSEAHTTLCEEARYLRSVTQIPLVAGQQEYDLPPDCCAVLRLYIGGAEITPIALDVAQSGLPGPYYYELDGDIGFTDTPTSAGTAYLYYARRPPSFTSYDDVPVFGPEFYYLLRHYAAWRIILLQRGAAGVALAQRQRAFFDLGAHRLRSEQILEVAPRRLATLVTP